MSIRTSTSEDHEWLLPAPRNDLDAAPAACLFCLSGLEWLPCLLCSLSLRLRCCCCRRRRLVVDAALPSLLQPEVPLVVVLGTSLSFLLLILLVCLCLCCPCAGGRPSPAPCAALCWLLRFRFVAWSGMAVRLTCTSCCAVTVPYCCVAMKSTATHSNTRWYCTYYQTMYCIQNFICLPTSQSFHAIRTQIMLCWATVYTVIFQKFPRKITKKKCEWKWTFILIPQPTSRFELAASFSVSSLNSEQHEIFPSLRGVCYFSGECFMNSNIECSFSCEKSEVLVA